MCSATAAVVTLQIVGAATAALGQIRKANAASNESDFKSRIATNNADIANQNSVIALKKGSEDVKDKRRETSQAIGLQRAQLAGAGFDVSSGSSIEILTDTSVLGEVDVLRIEEDAKNRSDNFKQQSSNFETEASLGRLASKSQKKSGKINAAGTLITGAARTASVFIK